MKQKQVDVVKRTFALGLALALLIGTPGFQAYAAMGKVVPGGAMNSVRIEVIPLTSSIDGAFSEAGAEDSRNQVGKLSLDADVVAPVTPNFRLASDAKTSVVHASGGILITTITNKMTVKAASGVELDRVITIEVRGSWGWWRNNSEALANINQGMYCAAYESCAEDGAFLDGGFKEMPGDCMMKDEANVMPHTAMVQFFTAKGSINFRCVDASGATVPFNEGYRQKQAVAESLSQEHIRAADVSQKIRKEFGDQDVPLLWR